MANGLKIFTFWFLFVDLGLVQADKKHIIVKRQFIQSYEPGSVSTRIDCSSSRSGCSVQSKNDLSYGSAVTRSESIAELLRSGDDVNLRTNDVRYSFDDPRSTSINPLLVSNNVRLNLNNPGSGNTSKSGKQSKTTNSMQSCICYPLLYLKDIFHFDTITPMNTPIYGTRSCIDGDCECTCVLVWLDSPARIHPYYPNYPNYNPELEYFRNMLARLPEILSFLNYPPFPELINGDFPSSIPAQPDNKPTTKAKSKPKREAPGSRFHYPVSTKQVFKGKALFRPRQMSRISKRDVPQLTHGSRFVVVSPYNQIFKDEPVLKPQPSLVLHKFHPHTLVSHGHKAHEGSKGHKGSKKYHKGYNEPIIGLPVVFARPTKGPSVATVAHKGSTKASKKASAVTPNELKEVSTDKLERVKRKSQFIQTYQAGSNSQNFNCGQYGCGDIKGNTQVIGGQVTNVGGHFNQDFYGGSAALNIGGGHGAYVPPHFGSIQHYGVRQQPVYG